MYLIQYELWCDKGWPYEVTVGGTTMAEALDEFYRFCQDGPHMGVRVRLTDIKEVI